MSKPASVQMTTTRTPFCCVVCKCVHLVPGEDGGV